MESLAEGFSKWPYEGSFRQAFRQACRTEGLAPGSNQWKSSHLRHGWQDGEIGHSYSWQSDAQDRTTAQSDEDRSSDRRRTLTQAEQVGGGNSAALRASPLTFGHETKPIVKLAFKAACILAIPVVFFTLMSGLTAPMLLGIGVLFCVPAALSIRSPQLHWLSVGISACSLSALMLIFFVPVWVASARAQTPADHRLVAEAYARRGQLFGNRSQAFEHYLTSAQGGDVEAQRRVGEAYLFRHYGVAHDTAKARQWLSAAASNGHPQAAQLLKSIEGEP